MLAIVNQNSRAAFLYVEVGGPTASHEPVQTEQIIPHAASTGGILADNMPLRLRGVRCGAS